MTDNQYDAHIWLSRMWNADKDIENILIRRERIVSSMSGIGKYDSEFIPTQTGENSTETKNLEYSFLTEQLEKKLAEMSRENVRTQQAIEKVDDIMLRGMLRARYILRLSWTEVGKQYHYGKSQMHEKYKKDALDAVYPYIPKEEIYETVVNHSGTQS